MWDISRRDSRHPSDDVAGEVETLAEALGSMARLKAERPTSLVWAEWSFYAVEARLIGFDRIGFVIRPSVEVEHELPSSCLPYDDGEIVALYESDRAIVAGDDHCQNCGLVQRGRYANRDLTGQSLFICSTCETWSTTLPTVTPSGPRSRPSGLAALPETSND